MVPSTGALTATKVLLASLPLLLAGPSLANESRSSEEAASTGAGPDRAIFVRHNNLVRRITVVPDRNENAYDLVHEDLTQWDACLEFSERLLPSWKLVRF